MGKRRSLVAAALVLAVVLIGGSVSSGTAARLIVNGDLVSSDVPPQNVHGRVLVPIRMVSEALGFDVVWHQEIQTVTVSRKGETYPIPQVTPGRIHLVVNGQEIFPDVPPQNINGRVMVPIRAVSEAFGLKVEWNQAAQAAIVGDLGPVVEVHFIDVGQGDAILVELPDGTNILVDGGPEGAATTILSVLAQEGIDRLDYVVATHPHADHIAGLDEVIESIPVGAVVMPQRSKDTQSYADLMAAISAAGLQPTWAEARTTLVDTDQADVFVLGPVRLTYSDDNDCSVVLKITYG
ncbi:MAG: MBL fold metallo-hydrolase [Alicyclobacillus sp.]|nr:MBL fold metallo-hydrolase [Alicyclobacillus sp.]